MKNAKMADNAMMISVIIISCKAALTVVTLPKNSAGGSGNGKLGHWPRKRSYALWPLALVDVIPPLTIFFLPSQANTVERLLYSQAQRS